MYPRDKKTTGRPVLVCPGTSRPVETLVSNIEIKVLGVLENEMSYKTGRVSTHDFTVTFLSSLSRSQLIQNFTIVWCQCDIRIGC
jgi:hypothetical protein